MVKVKIDKGTINQSKADALAFFIWEGGKDDSSYGAIDKKLGGRISALIKQKKFTGKKGAIKSIDTLGKLKADTVILAGLGKEKDFSPETLRRAAAQAAKAAASAWAGSLAGSIENLVSKERPADTLAQAVTEGAILSQYKFDHYRKKPKKSDAEKPELKNLAIHCKKDSAKVTRAAKKAEKACQGVFLARDLQNHPSNHATPSFIAGQARRFCRKAGVKIKVMGRKEIEKNKMGSFLAVAQGSEQEPKFLVMEHKKGPKNQKPTVLVGKGITFDTGGISLKPSNFMENMKFDMSGGAAVIGTMYAAGLMKIKKNIIGLVPLCENMPSGKAIKPGDVVKAGDGQTIEILNTDAEGRLILADALAYAKRYKPKQVIDLATLTGAMVISLGNIGTGLFSNDRKLADALLETSETTGERIWQFPMWDEYDKMLKSKVADVQNIGGRGAGSITAAFFLKRFTDYPWAHLDIAGTADNEKPTAPYQAAGGTGVGVRTLIEYLNG